MTVTDPKTGLPTNVIIGTVKGGADFSRYNPVIDYNNGGLPDTVGNQTLVSDGINYWTRISSFATNLENADTLLSGDSPQTIAGTAINDPLNGFSATPGSIEWQLLYNPLAAAIYWFDPSSTSSEKIQVTEGANIEDVSLPNSLPSALELYELQKGVFVDTGIALSPGSTYNFGPNGIGVFELFGVPLGTFEFGLGFVTGGYEDFVASGASSGATPELSTWFLILLGFRSVALVGRDRRQSLRGRATWFYLRSREYHLSPSRRT